MSNNLSFPSICSTNPIVVLNEAISNQSRTYSASSMSRGLIPQITKIALVVLGIVLFVAAVSLIRRAIRIGNSADRLNNTTRLMQSLGNSQPINSASFTSSSESTFGIAKIAKARLISAIVNDHSPGYHVKNVKEIKLFVEYKKDTEVIKKEMIVKLNVEPNLAIQSLLKQIGFVFDPILQLDGVDYVKWHALIRIEKQKGPEELKAKNAFIVKSNTINPETKVLVNREDVDEKNMSAYCNSLLKQLGLPLRPQVDQTGCFIQYI